MSPNVVHMKVCVEHCVRGSVVVVMEVMKVRLKVRLCLCPPHRWTGSEIGIVCV